MIPQTLFSYLGNVYRYKFLTNICTDYTNKHICALINCAIVTSKVTTPSHQLTCQHRCIASDILWGYRVHYWHRMRSDSRFKYTSISSGRCSIAQFIHTLVHTYSKPIFGQLSPPGKEAVFIRTIGSLGAHWGIHKQRIFHQRIICYLIRPLVALRVRVGTYFHKYLRPFWDWLHPPGKEMNFNRMNGSPGDPPGNLMDRIFNQRIVPFIHRLAGDPSSKEAGWETNIGDTKHVNKHIN